MLLVGSYFDFYYPLGCSVYRLLRYHVILLRLCSYVMAFYTLPYQLKLPSDFVSGHHVANDFETVIVGRLDDLSFRYFARLKQKAPVVHFVCS